jgi:hypothetical protein
MRTFAGLCLSCALAACTFAPSELAGDPGPSPAPDAAAAMDAAAPDGPPVTGPDASARDGGAPAAAFCDAADPELVGCFRFEDTTDDASGSDLDVDATAVGFDEGMSGRAAVFTAASVLRLPETSDLDLAAFTIEMWVRPDALPADPARAGLFDNDGQYGVFLFGPATVRCLASGEVEAVGVVAVGTWTHVACVHDGLNVTLYIDGSVRATAPAGPLGLLFNGSNIGGNSPDGNDHFLGRIDELRIWSRARTADEVCEAASCAASATAAALGPR